MTLSSTNLHENCHLPYKVHLQKVVYNYCVFCRTQVTLFSMVYVFKLFAMGVLCVCVFFKLCLKLCLSPTLTLMAAGRPPLLIQGCSSTSSRRWSDVK